LQLPGKQIAVYSWCTLSVISIVIQHPGLYAKCDRTQLSNCERLASEADSMLLTLSETEYSIFDMADESADNAGKRRVIIWLVVAVAMTLVIIGLFTYICTTGRLAGLMYRYTLDGKWLYSALYHGAENGDSIHEIESLLGRGRMADTKKLLGAIEKIAQQNPSAYPHGCQDTDTFLGFTLSSGELFLQFRNGALINFNRNDFAKYDASTSIGP